MTMNDVKPTDINLVEQEEVLKALILDNSKIMESKLLEKSKAGWNAWQHCPIEVLQDALIRSVANQDYIDVANYALLLKARLDKLQDATAKQPNSTKNEQSALWATRIERMLKMQDEVNDRLIGTGWREQSKPFFRAAWLETAELVNHLPWKWWKHGEIDMRQAQMEVVDIWHFGLSDLLTTDLTPIDIANLIYEFNANFDQNYQDRVFNQDLAVRFSEKFVTATINREKFSIPAFIYLMRSMRMTLDDIYNLYIGKAVLNKFRQDFGYKEGTYIKEWNGREDNEYLYDIIDSIKTTDEFVAEKIYTDLKNIYLAL